MVKYKDVVIGIVIVILLSDDSLYVVVIVLFVKNVCNFICDDMWFWVVWFCVGMSGVLGIDMLFFGVYIGMDMGCLDKLWKVYIGLEMLFIVINGMLGISFILLVIDFGLFDIGLLVYYYYLLVGYVVLYKLNM